MGIYQKRRLPTRRQELRIWNARLTLIHVCVRHSGYGVAGFPHRNTLQDRIVAYLLAFGRGVQGRFCHSYLVGVRS